MSVQRGSTEPDPRYLLSVYLRDHLAGATAGVRLAERCRRANSGTEFGLTLAKIEQDIINDRRSLREMMARLGVAESKAKELLGLAAEVLGRLKSNGRLIRYSPSSRVVELEALAAGVFAKRSLWLSLRAVADDYGVLDLDELDRLVATATKQYQRLTAEHDQAARTAFGPVLPPVEHVR